MWPALHLAGYCCKGALSGVIPCLWPSLQLEAHPGVRGAAAHEPHAVSEGAVVPLAICSYMSIQKTGVEYAALHAWHATESAMTYGLLLLSGASQPGWASGCAQPLCSSSAATGRRPAALKSLPPWPPPIHPAASTLPASPSTCAETTGPVCCSRCGRTAKRGGPWLCVPVCVELSPVPL